MRRIRTWEEHLPDIASSDDIADAMELEITALRAERVSVEAMEKAYQELHKKYVALVEKHASGPTPPVAQDPSSGVAGGKE